MPLAPFDSALLRSGSRVALSAVLLARSSLRGAAPIAHAESRVTFVDLMHEQQMMTYLKAVALVTGLSCCALFGFGQEPVTATRELPMVNGVPYTVVFQPVIADSTSHFLSKDLVCRCAYREQLPWIEWYKADWAMVRKCECASELYRLEFIWDDFFKRGEYIPRLIERDIRSTLTRASDTTFIYVEVPREQHPMDGKESLFLFDVRKVLQSDSSYFEDADSRMIRLTVEMMVELKRLSKPR